MATVECVPNVSEGRRPDVIRATLDAIRSVRGVRVLDASSDSSHNRTVLTLAGDATALKEAVLALFAVAIARIDLRSHRGEHPRLGAVDVVPFIPIAGATMADCVALARDTAAEVASRYDLPVFLYEEAASSPARVNLADIRRGEFEGLADKLSRPDWVPDFGPPRPHPTAGASVIGARMPLVAFNVTLDTDRIEIAKDIAAAVRHSSGGLPNVKAMGVRLEPSRLVQVSMNLTNVTSTPIFRVFEAVKREASRHGVGIAGSEIVGLVPSAALLDAAAYYLQLERFTPGQVLETRLRDEES